MAGVLKPKLPLQMRYIKALKSRSDCRFNFSQPMRLDTAGAAHQRTIMAAVRSGLSTQWIARLTRYRGTPLRRTSGLL